MKSCEELKFVLTGYKIEVPVVFDDGRGSFVKGPSGLEVRL